MLPKLQMLGISLSQILFYYLPESIIKWNAETGSLCKNQCPGYRTRLSFATSICLVIFFIISTINFAIQVLAYGTRNSMEELMQCLTAIMLSLMVTLALLCEAIASLDWTWIEGFNQLLRIQDILYRRGNYGNILRIRIDFQIKYF